ncbi:hypothetical protein GCM10027275_33850 [Rhabdobacter roseus]|uniref:Antitoxin n=1 Tax=Rhabdobacter roseus TaxID=1655419 RepID=A0A840TVV5_9BACT|nr:DUF6364 family protein [Rhabdobacter roseus]MBB5285393.1 hypothetical protein [Rhabdobacter roseus]
MMNTKLTLNLDKAIIEQAKDYAKNNKVSLSKLIENYLSSLTKSEKTESPRISPLVESLTGVIPNENLDNYREKHSHYLNKKYS